MRRLFRLALIAIPAFLLTGCATMSVGSYVQRGLDPSRYRTYEWASTERLKTGDRRLDDNPFFTDQVYASVEKALAAKGFTQGSPTDLMIHVDVRVTQRVEHVTTYDEYGACRDCEAYMYDAGTLTIDFIDTRTNQLVWRGWADQRFDGVIDNQDRMERTIDKTIAAILQRFRDSTLR